MKLLGRASFLRREEGSEFHTERLGHRVQPHDGRRAAEGHHVPEVAAGDPGAVWKVRDGEPGSLGQLADPRDETSVGLAGARVQAAGRYGESGVAESGIPD